MEMRYYILSEKTNAQSYEVKIRSHWSIENKVHWQLDVLMEKMRAKSTKTMNQKICLC